MRFLWTEEIRKSDLRPRERHAAHVYGDHLNTDGRCWISNATLAREMGYESTTSAEEAKALLIARGWLAVVDGGGGRGRAATVEARFPVAMASADQDVSTVEPPEDVGGTGATEPPIAEQETTRYRAENRPARWALTEGEQQRENTTTTTTTTADPDVDDDVGDDEIRSMVAWRMLDDTCRQIDEAGFECLPSGLRREALGFVASALAQASVESIAQQMRAPRQVTNKPGLILALARKVASTSPTEEGEAWNVVG